MNCIFCQSDLGEGVNTRLGISTGSMIFYCCRTCPVQVHQYVDVDSNELITYTMIVDPSISVMDPGPRYMIIVNPNIKSLEIWRLSIIPMGSPKTIFHMSNPPEIHPQEATNFVKRILDVKAFL